MSPSGCPVMDVGDAEDPGGDGGTTSTGFCLNGRRKHMIGNGALEEARRQHVTTLVERRRERETRAEELKELKSKEREEAAREKAEGYKTRKAALDALAEQEVDALRSRIQCKQEASEQRLEKHLQAIRTKATAPRVPTTSETQEQPTTEEDLIKKRIEENRERERQRNMRKRARKIRQKLLDAGREFEEMNAEDVEPLDYYSSMPETNRVYRCLTVINNTIEHLVPMEFRINNNKNEQKNEEAQTNKDNKENEKGNNQKGAKNQEENKNQQVNKNNKKKNKLVRKDSDEQFRTINNECKQGSLCIKTYEQNHRPENVRTEYSVASQKKKKKKNNAQQALVNGTQKSENETATDNSDPTRVEKTGENSSKASAGNSEPKTNGIAGTSQQSDEPDGDKKSNKKKKKPSDSNDNDDNTNTVTNGIAETQTTTNNANGLTNEGSSSTNGPSASMAKGKKGKGKGKQTNTNGVNSNTNGVNSNTNGANSNTNGGNSKTNEASSKTNEVANSTNGDITSCNNESSRSTNGVTSSTGAIPKVPVAKKSKGKQKQGSTNEVTSNTNGPHFKSNEASTNSKKFKGKNDWQLTNGFDEPKSGKNNRKNNRNTNAKDYQRPSTSRQDHNDSFLRKLSKESSLASSISDLSKISSKSERRRKERELQMAFDYVDWKALEKHVNELHIAVSRLDKEHQDILLNGLEVLSYILVIALMPESQGKITTKTLTVAVQMIGAVISACPMAAGFFLCTNNCVHQVTLLSVVLTWPVHRVHRALTAAVQMVGAVTSACPMAAGFFLCTNNCGHQVALLSVVLQERDLSDRQTLELAKQLCDCLSICVDAVLCGTRLLASSGDSERAHVACMRARAHPLIL
ncbi:unnamed protein product [Plutella xylostella]|uniref:(diamondback moth) hypothetical protein n=1 Tax=Plutella xylostella TaxID=51655 RepID=A0A8S4FV58_PLUXY|nr:unnamed protein product [Plutella xylostella]